MASKMHYCVCYLIGLGVFAFSFLCALLSIFLHYPEYASSKGDQKTMDKEKPYILYNQQPYNLPHFCRRFRILIADAYWEDDEMIVQATTSMERPIYSTNFSTFSFTEDIYLAGSQTRNLSYYLPSSSRVEITTCGQGLTRSDDTLAIPIFNNYGKMKKWLNSDEQNSESPDVFLYAQFPPCPSMTTISFNTNGFTNGRWYILLGIRHQDDADNDFRTTLELQFTKYSLEVPNPIDKCTAKPGDYCELDAPSGNDVYLMLEHSINSTYPYRSRTRVVCRSWDPLPSVMYFLVLPLGMSICYIVIYGLLIYCECGCRDDPSTSNVPNVSNVELTRIQYLDEDTWNTTRRSSLGDTTSSEPTNNLPGYDRADVSPTFNNDDELANNFSTEINSDDTSYLRHLPDILSSSTDVTMVTEPDDPPAYDSVTSFDFGSRVSLPPAPGYEEALELRASHVTMAVENPPSYYSLTPPD